MILRTAERRLPHRRGYVSSGKAGGIHPSHRQERVGRALERKRRDSAFYDVEYLGLRLHEVEESLNENGIELRARPVA